MTQEEIIHKAQEVYPDMHPEYFHMREGYRQALTDISSLPSIKGWIARDPHIDNPIDNEDKEVSDMIGIYPSKPIRFLDICWDRGADGCPPFILPKTMFPEITWDSEPVEVNIIIEKL